MSERYTKALRPFFTYFGGKWRAAKHYPEPSGRVLIEPFAGAAGYSLRYPDRNVILNDLSDEVAGTWDYIINAPESEIMSLPLYDGTWSTVNDLALPQEARWLIGWWLNKGTVRPSQSPSKWVRDAETMGENYWGAGVRARIAGQQQYIRHWTVACGDYRDLPDIDATWFIDPPYAAAGKDYRHGSSGIDFQALGEWCQQREGQVIVCENDGADWLPFRPFKSIKGTEGRSRSGVSMEVIWTNDRPLVPTFGEPSW